MIQPYRNADEETLSEQDPIVDEVREIRRRILEEHGNDLGRLFETLRYDQEKLPPGKLVMAPVRGIGPPLQQPHQ